LAGQPALPYTDFRSYVNSDVFVDMTFIDHTGTPQEPVSIWYQLDDITNVQNMVPQTAITPTGSSLTLDIPGSVMQMTHMWVDSQLCQLWVQATMPVTDAEPNGSVINAITIIELVAIQTPNNN
jgi:hypothetical protein